MKKILVVDDEKMIASAIQRVLQKAGHTVELAHNGVEAIKKLESTQPGTYDLIIMDLLMPEINGSDVLDWITIHRTGQKVIMMTAYGDNTTRQDLLKRGASDVLTKPFDDIMVFPKLVENI